MTREVNEDRVAWLNGRILDEMVDECVLDGLLGRVLVEQHLDVVAGNIKTLKPVLDGFGILDAGFEIPNAARLVPVNGNNQGE